MTTEAISHILVLIEKQKIQINHRYGFLFYSENPDIETFQDWYKDPTAIAKCDPIAALRLGFLCTTQNDEPLTNLTEAFLNLGPLATLMKTSAAKLARLEMWSCGARGWYPHNNSYAITKDEERNAKKSYNKRRNDLDSFLHVLQLVGNDCFDFDLLLEEKPLDQK